MPTREGPWNPSPKRIAHHTRLRSEAQRAQPGSIFLKERLATTRLVAWDIVTAGVQAPALPDSRAGLSCAPPPVGACAGELPFLRRSCAPRGRKLSTNSNDLWNSPAGTSLPSQAALSPR